MLTTVLGACYALFYAGGLRQKAFAILTELFFIASRLTTSSQGSGGDLTSITQLLGEFLNTTRVIIERVHAWVIALLVSEPAFDPVAAAFVWIALVWIIAAWAGWVAVAYRNALLAVMPVVMLSVATLAYGRSESLTLYLMLGLMLLVVATVQHIRREQGWDEFNTAYPPRKGRQIGIVAIIASVALVLLSAIVSSISIPRILEWVSASKGLAVQQESDLGQSLGIISRTTASPDIFEEIRHPGLPRDLLIGSGPELSKRIVMTVAVKDYISIFKGIQPQPLYWRSFTYDTYTGNGWQSSATSMRQYQANLLLRPEQAPQHILIEQVVRPVGRESSILYAAGDPVAVNHSSEVARRSPDDLFGVVLGGAGSYEAGSLISVASEQSLQAEEHNYPDWVRQRFMYLPPDLPSRVKELALQLTASEPTPYDRVRAIERYLRTIPYTLDVPYPPQDQDLVDYFLFELQKGYCDYYASAMVVLARAAGVPARFVIGYANGTYDLKAERFLVTEADAHSWVEVYFPTAGWVPFEPTAGRPPLDRSKTTTTNLDVKTTFPEENPFLARPGSNPLGWQLLLGVLSSISIFGIAWVAFDEIRLRALPESTVAGEVYLRLRRYGAHLAVPLETGDTPDEYAALLGSRIQEISQIEITKEFYSKAFEQISTLTSRIVETSFRPSKDQDKSEKLIFEQWKGLRWRLSMLWLMRYYQSGRDRLLGAPAGHSNNNSAGVARED